MRPIHRTLPFVTLLILAACAAPEPEYPRELDMTTWSVVGVDPLTGDVGVAVASWSLRDHPHRTVSVDR